MPTRLGPGPLAAGLAAVILWGLAPVATRAAVAHLAPLPLLVLRLTVASLVMLPWAVPLFRRLRPRSAGRNGRLTCPDRQYRGVWSSRGR